MARTQGAVGIGTQVLAGEGQDGRGAAEPESTHLRGHHHGDAKECLRPGRGRIAAALGFGKTVSERLGVGRLEAGVEEVADRAGNGLETAFEIAEALGQGRLIVCGASDQDLQHVPAARGWLMDAIEDAVGDGAQRCDFDAGDGVAAMGDEARLYVVAKGSRRHDDAHRAGEKFGRGGCLIDQDVEILEQSRLGRHGAGHHHQGREVGSIVHAYPEALSWRPLTGPLSAVAGRLSTRQTPPTNAA